MEVFIFTPEIIISGIKTDGLRPPEAGFLNSPAVRDTNYVCP